MSARQLIALSTWPDPLMQERIEDIGFFFDRRRSTWVRFCDSEEVVSIGEWLKTCKLSHQTTAAAGAGQLVRYPKISAMLKIRDGGGPDSCGLCGARGVLCRQWIEGDDCDSIEYPNPARFFLCGKCVQHELQPHPRLYIAVDDAE